MQKLLEGELAHVIWLILYVYQKNDYEGQEDGPLHHHHLLLLLLVLVVVLLLLLSEYTGLQFEEYAFSVNQWINPLDLSIGSMHLIASVTV